MKAITYHGFKNVRVDNVEDPKIQKPEKENKFDATDITTH